MKGRETQRTTNEGNNESIQYMTSELVELKFAQKNVCTHHRGNDNEKQPV
jgi:hypothetical protein